MLLVLPSLSPSPSLTMAPELSAELNEIVKKNFDLRPGRIVKDLKLKNPIFQQTASYGHFGRDIFTWEQPKNLSF